jgi:hypothetical protein
MNDVNQIRIPQNKIIAETKIRKEMITYIKSK